MASEYVVAVVRRIRATKRHPPRLEKALFWGSDEERQRKIRLYKKATRARLALQGERVVKWLQYKIESRQ
ncbi:MAG TPA: hypothetical protein VFP46_00500 [Candidatus Paceibacterota bacterium]|nr:hypothetical protein [Candidatus Paceibacterota bacterium]